MRLIFYQNQLVKYAFLIEIPKKAGKETLSRRFWKTKLNLEYYFVMHWYSHFGYDVSFWYFILTKEDEIRKYGSLEISASDIVYS